MTKVLFLFGLALAAVAASTLPTNYAPDFDDIDLDEILQNRTQVEIRVNCLLDKGECPPDAARVKLNVEDALENGCRKCTEKQRNGVLKVMKSLSNDYPELMQKLYDKFDPEGLYRTKYEKEFKDAGINLLKQP